MVSKIVKPLIKKTYEKQAMKDHGIFSPGGVLVMLEDTKLRNLKPQGKLYKVNDTPVAPGPIGI
jgi:hypothetical protein